jgi:hypothetical protein
MPAQIAVPVAIVLLWLSSLSAQVGRVWPNFQSEQKAQSEQEEKSVKGKSQQAGKSSSPSEHRKIGQSSPTAASKDGHQRQD